MSLPRVFAIVGPTASGKTPVSLDIAGKLGGEIVSADSRQVYKYLDIGTAKPDRESITRVPHFFIDILDPKEDYSAGQYGKDAGRTIEEILKRKKIPVIVGGSGLYLKAVVDGLFEGPGKDPEIRDQLERRLQEEGKQSLWESLKNVDPHTAEVTDSTKVRRVIRALEVYFITGRPIGELHVESKAERKFEVVQFGLHWDRKLLYSHIDQRVDRMIEKGLFEETLALKKRGYTPKMNSLHTVGYNEAFDYLEGRLDRKTAVDQIKRNTRRYAKRQITWFRADNRIRWIDMNETNTSQQVVETITECFLKDGERLPNR